MFMYPGFYVQPRTLRKYSKPIASHLLGYVSEVDEGIIRKDPYYKPGIILGRAELRKPMKKNFGEKEELKFILLMYTAG